MKQSTSCIYNGANTKVDCLLVNRLVPNPEIQKVGAFVLLDHTYPVKLPLEKNSLQKGINAHPHRGMVTISYVLNGSLLHKDSKGNHEMVKAGGLHWMKAGKGILHEEKPASNQDPADLFHALQFWINLAADTKKEEAEYRTVHAQDVPELELPDYAGKIRILLGGFCCSDSLLKTFHREFIFHIQLNPKSEFILPLKSGQTCAAFVPSGEVMINGKSVKNSELLVLEANTINLVLQNSNIY